MLTDYELRLAKALQSIAQTVEALKLPPAGTKMWCEHMEYDKNKSGCWQLVDCAGARRITTADMERTAWEFCPICGTRKPALSV